MQTHDQHIIHKVFVEITTDSSTKANDIRINSQAYIQANVLSVVDDFIRRLEPKLSHVTVQIEPITLDLAGDFSRLSKVEMRERIEEQLSRIFEPILRAVKNQNGKRDGDNFQWSPVEETNDPEIPKSILLSPEAREVQSILYFLKTGVAPWWISKHSELRELLSDSNMLVFLESAPKHFYSEIRQYISNATFRKRILRQFSDQVILVLSERLGTKKHSLAVDDIQKIAKRVSQLGAHKRFQFLEMILENGHTEIAPSKMRERIRTIAKSTPELESELSKIANTLLTSQSEIQASKHWSLEMKLIQSLLYFLEKGTRPPWIDSEEDMLALFHEDSLLALFKKAPSTLILPLRQKLQSANVRKRMLMQFSPVVIIRLLCVLDPKFMTQRLANEQVLSVHFKALTETEQTQLFDLLIRLDIGLVTEIQFVREIFSLSLGSETTITQIVSIIQLLLMDQEYAFERLHVFIDSLKLEDKKRAERPTAEEIKARIEKEIEVLIAEEIKAQTAEKIKAQYAEDIKKSSAETNTMETNLSEESVRENETKPKPKEPESLHNAQVRELLITENAGLILLNPFLKPFFKNLELLDENDMLTDPVLATHILHYLATGEEQDFEFTMILEAYLCGLPVDEPIPRKVELSEEIKSACNDMLLAVLGHWKALKSQSIPLLQKEFLQREGKLFLKEEPPRITVERKSIDILLDKIPWTISMLKLPWKSHLIYVEW